MNKSDAVWSLKGVTFLGRTRPRLNSVSLDIPSGVTAVMGSSGAGKSSLLGLLTDFEKPDTGDIKFQSPNSSVSLPLFWSPQDHGLWPHLNVAQHVDYVFPEKPKLERSTSAWLDLFGLDELREALPESLSQGERSRLAVVRALASEASVLVLDEPLVHVDAMLANRCWQILEDHIQTCCSAVVFSTHDPDAVLKYAQNVICLAAGVVEFSGMVETLYRDPPSKELAWLLGPCNWLDKDAFKADADLSLSGGESNCVRPSQLELRKDSNGQFVVAAILRGAATFELRLRSLNSESMTGIFLSQLNADIVVGDNVQLVVDKAFKRSGKLPAHGNVSLSYRRLT